MNSIGHHAVVLGASWAGLLHAVTLAERFDRVTLVERDVLPAASEARRGVPQDRHIHLLVPGGVRRLEEMLPGVLADLVTAGGRLIHAKDWRFHMGGGRLALSDSDLLITGATRPLMESVVRDRVVALDQVELLEGWNARGVTATADRGRVTGLRIQSQASPDEERTLDADLVVDTTGRGSPSPRWLADLGYGTPEEQHLKVDVRYTTRLFRRHPDDLGGCQNVLVDVPPDGSRGGVALVVEDDRWLVTLIGMGGDRPPADLDAFGDYAATLTTPDLHEIVEGAEPLGEACQRAFPTSSWRRYDRMRRLPEGFAVSGDAVSSFDPRFGQGMTVAIVEAMELARVLDDHGLDDVGSRFIAAAQWVVQDAWDLAAGSDLANVAVEGPRPLSWRMTNAYMQRLVRAAHEDPVVADAFVRVIGMVDRPAGLMHPRILARVLAQPRLRSRTADRVQV